MAVLLPLAASAQEPSHDVAAALKRFEHHPDIEVEPFANEPMLVNPTNIDIDHRGRVWVCEVVNYRHFRNTDMPPRSAGDRILVLEDTDGDARADRQHVFYQGPEIDSAHGICVLGNRVIVSANDKVLSFFDDDGDLRADRHEVLFSGIGGAQHDHGIHAFVFGPDGKLYFNFGNEGRQLKDAAGQPIRDLAGNLIQDQRQPYNQGMVFRCNLDGSQVETLGWNFRNNWEVCVDSYGRLWQSDNDDDGNRSTRINFVVPFGDYGYTDQKTGAGWRTERTGMHADVPQRHWHQNDPGVIPNLLVTGAGSPTGICFYEGELLAQWMQQQVLHCDAGPNVVRCYPTQPEGAGYRAEQVALLDGSRENQWFRPSDICVAPDGSVLVADWYDAGVGGHRMVDIGHGRIYRLAPPGQQGRYPVPEVDLATPTGAVAALTSPNQATRFLAWQAIARQGANALPALKRLLDAPQPHLRARALWACSQLSMPAEQRIELLLPALSEEDPRLRETAVRILVQMRDQWPLEEIHSWLPWGDPDAGVRRELLIGLRQWQPENLVAWWTELAAQASPEDRWYLEALGIAAAGHWDACLEAVDQQPAIPRQSELYRWLVWRSRGTTTASRLVDILRQDDVDETLAARLMRSFDFLEGDLSGPLTELAFPANPVASAKQTLLAFEAAARLGDAHLQQHRAAWLEFLSRHRDDRRWLAAVDRVGAEPFQDELLDRARRGGPQAAESLAVLLRHQHDDLVREAVLAADEDQRKQLHSALVACGQRRACLVLAQIARDANVANPVRTEAVRHLGEIRAGAGDLMKWIEEDQPLDASIRPALIAALHAAADPQVRSFAQSRFALPASKDARPLPAIADLVRRSGDAERGKRVFDNAGTCAKCHVVANQGTEVGPNLTEIGNKLAPAALYESILFPSAGISHNYENWLVTTVDGQSLAGILISQSPELLELKDDKGTLHRIPTADIEARQRQATSLMPEGLHQQISEQELIDLVEYLKQLRG